jgi:hypothetical protein
VKKNLIFILIFLFLYVPLNNIDTDSFTEFTYHSIACREHINNTITIQEVLDWFTHQGYKTYKIVNRKKDDFDIKYCFTERNKTIITLELQYNNKAQCENIILNMCVNGTPRYFYNTEAKRMLRALLSYNTEFDYYIQR